MFLNSQTLGHSWDPLGRSRDALRALLGTLGELLGRSWAPLGRSWGTLGRSWDALGPLCSDQNGRPEQQYNYIPDPWAKMSRGIRNLRCFGEGFCKGFGHLERRREEPSFT